MLKWERISWLEGNVWMPHNGISNAQCSMLVENQEGWWVYDFVFFPVAGPFKDRAAAEAAFMVML